jgi:hypothetical protein
MLVVIWGEVEERKVLGLGLGFLKAVYAESFVIWLRNPG